MPKSPIMLEIELGPLLRTGCDLLEYACELHELIPEWHKAERDELAARFLTLHETLFRHAKGKFRIERPDPESRAPGPDW